MNIPALVMSIATVVTNDRFLICMSHRAQPLVITASTKDIFHAVSIRILREAEYVRNATQGIIITISAAMQFATIVALLEKMHCIR